MLFFLSLLFGLSISLSLFSLSLFCLLCHINIQTSFLCLYFLSLCHSSIFYALLLYHSSYFPLSLFLLSYFSNLSSTFLFTFSNLSVTLSPFFINYLYLYFYFLISFSITPSIFLFHSPVFSLLLSLLNLCVTLCTLLMKMTYYQSKYLHIIKESGWLHQEIILVSNKRPNYERYAISDFILYTPS